MASLSGRTALVTGAGSGIGRAIAVRIAKDGGNVAILDLDTAGARQTAAEVTALGRQSIALAANVVDGAAVRAEVEKARSALGPITIVVNNAGIGEAIRFTDTTDEQWDLMIAVHVKGTFNCTKAVLPDMLKARAGRIISISSVAGLMGEAGLVHYSAAKAAILGFTKALAKELGPQGITVNAIAPGIIDTPILRKGGMDLSKFIEPFIKRSPLRRIGKPEDIAAACAFLASDESSFFTGQVMSPNGGIWT